MEAAEYKKSREQCSSKIKKLRFEYKKIKDEKGKTGEGWKEWKYFEVIDKVLGHKPTTQPPVLVESVATTSTVEVNTPQLVERSKI